MSPLRVCYPSFDQLYEYNGDGQIEGLLEQTVLILLHAFHGLNWTQTGLKSIGSLVNRQTLEYDGCLGSLQRNESDVLVNDPMDFLVPGPNLTHGIVDGSEKIGILSFYNRTETETGPHTDVLDMVFAFSAGLWIVTSCALITLCVSLHSSLRVNGKRTTICMKRTTSALEACVLKQHSGCKSVMPSISSVLFIYTLMTLLMFLIGFHLTSMIKTEMVVVERPITVESYTDLINSKKRPLWLVALNDWQIFRDAKPGSKKSLIWKTAERRDLNDSLVSSDMNSLFSHSMAAARQEEVMLIKRHIGIATARIICAYSRSKNTMPDVFTLYREDESAEEKLQGHVYNRLLHSRVAKHINRRQQLVFQSGLYDASLRFLDFSAVLGADMSHNYSATADCASNVVKIRHPEYTAADLLHYVSLLWLAFPLIWFALCLLLFELYYKH